MSIFCFFQNTTRYSMHSVGSCHNCITYHPYFRTLALGPQIMNHLAQVLGLTQKQMELEQNYQIDHPTELATELQKHCENPNIMMKEM